MKVVQLNFRDGVQRMPQCSCYPKEVGWYKQRKKAAATGQKDPDRCMRAAAWELGGQPYCQQHARLKVLELLPKLQKPYAQCAEPNTLDPSLRVYARAFMAESTKDRNRCIKPATYEVDGAGYCDCHAGRRILKKRVSR